MYVYGSRKYIAPHPMAVILNIQVVEIEYWFSVIYVVKTDTTDFNFDRDDLEQRYYLNNRLI